MEATTILIAFVNLTHDVGKRCEDQTKGNEDEE